ncbi:MAG: hypothetical protein ACJ8DC_10535 [Gemmatimonadales bacterium]
MRLKHVSVALIALAVVVAGVGWWRERSHPQPRLESARDSVLTVVRQVGPPMPEPAARQVPDARSAFLKLHDGDLRSTFDVADVLLDDSLALALTRYSIGHTVYHDIVWLRRVGRGWFPTDRQLATPSDSPPQPDSLQLAATRWLREGAARWW